VVVQTPNVFGTVTDVTPSPQAAHAGCAADRGDDRGRLLGLLKPPGEMGADIAVAEGQSIGNGLNFGGPYVGLFACRRSCPPDAPGRLCGETVDADGERGFVLTLSTREQHIRRDKATSNICTNSGLCALAFSIHMTCWARRGCASWPINHARARDPADALAASRVSRC
jgi:glycine dehydrogenase subunit 1